MNSKILHLDDDPMMLMKIEHALNSHPFDMDFEYLGVEKANDFFDKFNQIKPDCVLLDLMLGQHSKQGLRILEKLRSSGYSGVVIIISSVGSSEGISECIEAGANDFITKGLGSAEISYRIAHASRGASYNSVLPKVEVAGQTMVTVQRSLEKVIASPISSVLVFGESGTGKEMVSRLLRSAVGDKTPFVSIDCGAIPPTLMEAEFFGHTKGSFTGASAARVGYFRAADGGWLFLDEVGNLSYTAQGALLRVLETGEVRPIGSSSSTHVKVRIVAATNVDLSAKVREGSFRGDLLERLRTYEIQLPPLRMRPQPEIEDIFEHLVLRLNNTCRDMGLSSDYRVAPEARQILCSYHWSAGNIREMWNVLQACSVEACEDLITVKDLPKRLRRFFLEDQQLMEGEGTDHQTDVHEQEESPRAPLMDQMPTEEFKLLNSAMLQDVPLQDVLDEVECAIIRASLHRHRHRAGAYEGLGISRSSLNLKRRKYGL